MNFWIVWNNAKTEGFVTTDKQVGYEARKGADSNCFSEDGGRSHLAQAFCEIYSHEEDCTMHEVDCDRPTGITASAPWSSDTAALSCENGPILAKLTGMSPGDEPLILYPYFGDWCEDRRGNGTREIESIACWMTLPMVP